MDIVRRNLMLVTIGTYRVKGLQYCAVPEKVQILEERRACQNLTVMSCHLSTVL